MTVVLGTSKASTKTLKHCLHIVLLIGNETKAAFLWKLMLLTNIGVYTHTHTHTQNVHTFCYGGNKNGKT